MCLAIPARVLEVHGTEAVISVQGVQRTANLMLLEETVDDLRVRRVGDVGALGADRLDLRVRGRGVEVTCRDPVADPQLLLVKAPLLDRVGLPEEVLARRGAVDRHHGGEVVAVPGRAGGAHEDEDGKHDDADEADGHVEVAPLAGI